VIVTALGHSVNRLGEPKRFNLGDRNTRLLVDTISQTFLDMKPDGFIYSGRLGFDMMAALVAMNAGIPYVIMSPYRGYMRSRTANWPSEAIEYFELLAGNARRVRYVSGPYAANKEERHLRQVIRHCDCVLALWNGENNNMAEIVRLSWSMRRDVRNLWSDYVQRATGKSI
jgi:hypothetical protein